jgi:choline kinase
VKNPIKAIILSAGQGRRLMPLTESVPKCCLPLDGKTLLEWQIDSLTANGVNDIVVVTGFGHHVVESVISRIKGVNVRTLYNPFYALSDNLGTCWVVRGEMTQPFLLMNGDTLFEPSVLSLLLSSDSLQPITLATDHKSSYDDDDMKIIAEGKRLLRVGKKLELDEVNGESIGMMRFNQAGADAFVARIEALMEGPDGLARWYLSAIDELARTGLVSICSIHGQGWCEVDDLDDLRHAETVVSAWRKLAAINASGLPGDPGKEAGSRP